MSTSFARNGHADYDDDWQAALDYAADQRRYAPWHDDAEHTDHQPLRDRQTPCENPACCNLTIARFCCEQCRLTVEGDTPDEEDDAYTATVTATTQAPLPEAPVSKHLGKSNLVF